MGYASTVDTGQVTPALISNEGTIESGALTSTLSSAAPRCYAFELQTQTVILGGKWSMGATATGKTNMAIYTLAGNLVAGSDSGQITNVASVDNTFTYTTPVSLAPGQYFMAIACNNTTDTYLGRGAPAATACYRNRVATNTLSGTAMPATLGALITGTTSIGCSFTVQGGL